MKTGSTVVLQRRTALAISTFLTSHRSLGRKHTACACVGESNSNEDMKEGEQEIHAVRGGNNEE